MDCEIFVMVDSDGNYEVSSDPDDAAEKYSENIGGNPKGAKDLQDQAEGSGSARVDRGGWRDS